MITKYASKPNFNPNEPNAAWPKPPCFGSFTPAAGRPHSGSRLPTSDSLLFYILICAICEICGSICFYKNKPNFFTTKYALLNQKRRNGGQKTTQKNETNPIMDNFLTNWISAEVYPREGGGGNDRMFTLRFFAPLL